MNTIINQNDKKDRQGLIAKNILAENVITKICSLSNFTNSLILALNIVNKDIETAEVSIWISDQKIPTDIDLIEYKIQLQTSAVYVRNTVILGLNESIFMMSNKNNVIVRVDGYDNRSL